MSNSFTVICNEQMAFLRVHLEQLMVLQRQENIAVVKQRAQLQVVCQSLHAVLCAYLSELNTSFNRKSVQLISSVAVLVATAQSQEMAAAEVVELESLAQQPKSWLNIIEHYGQKSLALNLFAVDVATDAGLIATSKTIMPTLDASLLQACAAALLELIKRQRSTNMEC